MFVVVEHADRRVLPGTETVNERGDRAVALTAELDLLSSDPHRRREAIAAFVRLVLVRDELIGVAHREVGRAEQVVQLLARKPPGHADGLAQAELGDPAQAPWRNIILHQTEGAPGAARSLAETQAKNPTRRGVTLWVETDGTVYWATPETIVTTHGDGANRNDNKYIDNSTTNRQVTRVNSIGVEFNVKAPDVRVPPTPEQFAASLLLVRFLALAREWTRAGHEVVVVCQERAPEHFDRAAGRSSQTFENLHRRRLAGTVRPKQTEAFTRAHLKIKTVDRSNITVTFDEFETTGRGCIN